MVGGRYVAPSIFQNLAGLANQYVGQKGIEKAEQAQIDLAKAIRQGDIAATADFMSTKQGRPAEMFAAQAGPMPTGGNIPIQEAKAAIAPNPQAAYANLYADPRASGRLQNLAFNKMFAEPEGFILPEGANRVEDEELLVGAVLLERWSCGRHLRGPRQADWSHPSGHDTPLEPLTLPSHSC
jgi:hypothetical protein